jgi:hypothetical protein
MITSTGMFCDDTLWDDDQAGECYCDLPSASGIDTLASSTRFSSFAIADQEPEFWK